MTDQTTGVLDRYGRFLWGGAALLLLLVLVASVVLPGSSHGGSEADAQARAESLSGSFIEKELSADLLARDITGVASRHLTVLVQAVIRSDDRFTTVRIWRLDGALIYSTAQGDDTGVIAADDRWIGEALDGRTVSVFSSAGTYHDGLERPDEELFQTFVPITLSEDGTVDGVVQIDQRSSSIHGQAGRIWRPLQLVVSLLLIAVGVMFIRWLRRAPASLEHERRVGHGRRAEDHDVLARADRAERAARETQRRLRELEAALAAAPTIGALEELDLKLRASEAEREELVATIQRLQATLSERDTDVALARDGSGSSADTKRINQLIADAESKAAAADRKAAVAEMKSQEAAKRATVTAERALEMEAQLKEAEQRAADAERRATETAEPVTNRESAHPTIAAKLKRIEDERDQLMARLGQLERAGTKGSATSAKGDGSKRGSRSSKAPVAQTTSSSDERRSRSRTPG
jgi:hypothetical protein